MKKAFLTPIILLIFSCAAISQNLTTTNPSLEISSYPQPASQYINLKANQTMRTVSIFDLSGKKVKDHFVEAKEVTIDIMDLPNGVYIARVTTMDSKEKSMRITVF